MHHLSAGVFEEIGRIILLFAGGLGDNPKAFGVWDFGWYFWFGGWSNLPVQCHWLWLGEDR